MWDAIETAPSSAYASAMATQKKPSSVGKKPAATKKAAPAKPAAKKAASKAPASSGGSVVPAFLKTLQPWQAELVQGVEALVLKAAPGTTSVTKWSHPVFERNGHPFALVKASSKHVLFGFWGGKELVLKDPKGLLEGESLRHVKLIKPEDLNRPELAGFIKEALAFNGA